MKTGKPKEDTKTCAGCVQGCRDGVAEGCTGMGEDVVEICPCDHHVAFKILGDEIGA